MLIEHATLTLHNFMNGKSVFRSPSPISGGDVLPNVFRSASALLWPTSIPGPLTNPVALPLNELISVPNTISAPKYSFKKASTIILGFAVNTHLLPQEENTRHVSGCKSLE